MRPESTQPIPLPQTVAPAHNADGLMLTFYGDDFTGSTDVMEALTINGIRTVLFLKQPTREQLQAYEGVGAIGVAGVSRTMSPEQMDELLPPIFNDLKMLGAPLFHYKMCSTFDSSPKVGSVGHAIELARGVFGAAPVPLVVGAPALGRYVVFGNLFAKAGAVVHRLDRHPTMMTHPVTPMHESDLRLNLATQCNLHVEALDMLALAGPDETTVGNLDKAIGAGAEVLLVDVLDERSQRAAGVIIDQLVRRNEHGDGSQVVVGSAGVEYALTARWFGATRSAEPNDPAHSLAFASPTLAVVGSRALATDAQTAYALSRGFVPVEVNPSTITGPSTTATIQHAAEAAAMHLAQDHNVLIHTPRSSLDRSVDGTALTGALGGVTRAVASKSNVRRLIVAGGDTSGMVARSLGIDALEILAPLTPGAPLCRVSAQSEFDGMEICLKGGQVGAADYFVRIAELGHENGPRGGQIRKGEEVNVEDHDSRSRRKDGLPNHR